MSRSREANRAKVRDSKKEESLNLKTEFGINDPTPKAAVDNIIRKERRIE